MRLNLCFLKGWRTLGSALGLVVCGILGAAGTIDLTPLVALFVKDPAYLGAAMVLVGLFFGFLRSITSSSIFRREPEGVDEAPELKRGLDAGM